MPTKHLKHIAIAAVLAIASGIAFAMLYSVFNPPETPPETTDTFKPPTHRRARVRLQSPAVFDAEAFKRTIIDNNLFRPLGWQPTPPREPYRLLGTLLPRDANTPPQAILQTTAGEQTYIVSIGDKLDASTRLVSIESKSVTLSADGQQRTLKLPSVF